MIGPAWYWARAELRRRWAAWLSIALIVGIGGGLAMGALAGARRTDSAYPRFLRDADPPDFVLDPDFEADGPEFLDAVSALPQVVDRSDAQAVALGRVVDGRVDLGGVGTTIASVDGERFYERDRVAVQEGRMPDPARTGEVLLSATAADEEGLGVGDRITYAVLGVDDVFSGADELALRDDMRLVDVEVVGIGVFPEMAVVDQELAPDVVLVTPALYDELPETSHLWSRAGVHLAAGADPEAVQRDIKDLAAAAGGDTFFEDRGDLTDRAQRAIRPYVLALHGLGAAGAVFMALLGAQLVRRTVASAQREHVVLVALSAAPRTVRLATALPAVTASAAATAVGLGVVALVSRWTPVGPVRPIEPDAGLHIDWVVAGPGLAVLAAVCTVPALYTGRRFVERSAPAGALTGWATRAGAPLSLLLGLERATGVGHRAHRSAARSGLAAVALATTMLVAVATFAASLDHLVDNPDVHGWNADVGLLADGGYGAFDLASAAEVEGVAAISGGVFGNVGIEDTSVPGLGLIALRGDLLPPITEGRAPRGPDEIALGRTSLTELGAAVGDVVDVRIPGEEPMPMTIVGTTVLPGLGPIDNDRPALGNGALLVLPPEVAEGDDMGWSLLLADLEAGTDRAAVVADLLSAAGDQVGETDVFDRFRPADIAAFAEVGAVPLSLAGLFAAVALASLVHVLIVAGRAWRRDRATLAAMGATPRQLRGVVRWHAAAVVVLSLAIALPVGTALGRWAWRSLALEVGIVPQPVLPVAAGASLVLLLLVASIAATAIPERLHARVHPARHLRAE